MTRESSAVGYERVQAEQPAAGSPRVALLTGGFDRHYAFGLAMALSARGIPVDVIGGPDVDSAEFHTTPGLRYFDFHGERAGSALHKLFRLARLYLRTVRYTMTPRAGIYHILWNNKLQLLDRTVMMLFYRLMGKRVAMTAHNVNAGARDGNDSWLNRLTLRIQYHLCDCIFVHTARMKTELISGFGVAETSVVEIPYGMNNCVPDTDLTPEQARKKLGLGVSEKVILFFGAIRPYKGLEYLVDAFEQLAPRDADYRLVIAGERKKGSDQYLDDILERIRGGAARAQVTQRIEFVPDEETEFYFKAADVLVLPYTLIFQSGVLILSYSFGLPAIASDVGSFDEDILEGRTGFVYKAGDRDDMVRAIEQYFASSLYKELSTRRAGIREYARQKHSWERVAELTTAGYGPGIEH